MLNAAIILVPITAAGPAKIPGPTLLKLSDRGGLKKEELHIASFHECLEECPV